MTRQLMLRRDSKQDCDSTSLLSSYYVDNFPIGEVAKCETDHLHSPGVHWIVPILSIYTFVLCLEVMIFLWLGFHKVYLFSCCIKFQVCYFKWSSSRYTLQKSIQIISVLLVIFLSLLWYWLVCRSIVWSYN